MTLRFFKYHGAGNDFILINDRRNDDGKNGVLRSPLPPNLPLHPRPRPNDRLSCQIELTQAQIARLCHRNFGVGADGLILLRDHPEYDFEMVYYNSDGHPSSMCGNGGRCIVRFARDVGMIGDACRFLAVDGPHEARILPGGWVSLEMKDVAADGIEDRPESATVLDTGSPHYVTYADVNDVDVVRDGRAVRYGLPEYAERGINVNFVRAEGDTLRVLTYERGVENETLACGTGVTAAAIVDHRRGGGGEGNFSRNILAKGGNLRVRGRLEAGVYRVTLEGPAEFVFAGKVVI